jgi:chromosome segregation ATPase
LFIFLSLTQRSLKTQSLDVISISKKETSTETASLKRELNTTKSNNQQQQQEIQALNSKLEDERHKICRIENLLALRGEYIKTLQDADEVSKARLILQIREIEDLRSKISSAKKFKAASNEDLNNLHNKLKQQEYDIQKLETEIGRKDKKLEKYKQKLMEAKSR